MEPLRILALDLGTRTGIAHNCTPTGSVTAWTERLSTDAEVTAWGKTRLNRRNDPRISRLAAVLRAIPSPHVVIWEDVQFSSYTSQVQLWSSFRTVIWLTLGTSCLLECVPVTTLKKFATNHGGATKEMMEAALRRVDPGIFKQYPTLGDDAIDALWLFRWAEKNLARVAR